MHIVIHLGAKSKWGCTPTCWEKLKGAMVSNEMNVIDARIYISGRFAGIFLVPYSNTRGWHFTVNRSKDQFFVNCNFQLYEIKQTFILIITTFRNEAFFISNKSEGMIFLLDPFYRRGRVYKRKFCVCVCLSVITFTFFEY